MSNWYLAEESTSAVWIAAVAAVLGAFFGAVGAYLAARHSSRGAVGAAAQTGADAYGKSVRETRLAAYHAFATSVRGMVSKAQDMSNLIRAYNLTFGEDDRPTLPTQAELLALAEAIGDDVVRVRIAGPKIVADAAYEVLEKAGNMMGDVGDYLSLTASSFMPIDNPDMPIAIMLDRPIIRHAEVQSSTAIASDALGRFLDTARDHLDDWNGQAA
ncbi:hypothetical protein [Streptomyces sp. NPDC056387]|uniref:hypothetical protein n=1 Tax=Streptomyces sp. NPDC056387 TaxID=3345803 RepID=UPI0035E1B284